MKKLNENQSIEYSGHVTSNLKYDFLQSNGKKFRIKEFHDVEEINSSQTYEGYLEKHCSLPHK